MDLLLEGVVGSTAHGLATATSDVDYAGIYVEPTAHLLGLHPPSPARSTRQGRSGADATYHEVGKALRLLLTCNPTATELLWLETHTVRTDFGNELLALRRSFLTARRVRDAYFGYATSQYRRLLTPGCTGARREKQARHTMRVLWQGHRLYTTGHLPVRLPDPGAVFEFGRRVGAEPGAASAAALLATYERRFDEARSALPDTADEAPLEDLLQRIRRARLAPAPPHRSAG